MRIIELEGWHRKGHFDLYNRFEFPHVSVCVNIDITKLWENRASSDVSPTIMLVYIVTKATNRVPEMRQRIRADLVVEHEVIHPLITIMGKDDLFGVVTLEYDPDYEIFKTKTAERLEQAEGDTTLDEFPHQEQGQESAKDDLLSITILPWLAFTSFSLTRKPREDCIPLFAIGKVHKSEGRHLMPFFVNVHHALADGLHIARLVKYIEEESQELAKSFG
jgi:chloramphenicol O-acetyltransferase type A